jgi:hypothetical protein
LLHVRRACVILLLCKGVSSPEYFFNEINEFHYILYGNWALRRTFEPKKDESTQEWRKLNSEELHNMYSSPNIIWKMKKKNEACGSYGTHGKGDKGGQGFGGKARRKETTRKTKA